MADFLLEVRGLSRRFAAVEALKDVNFAVTTGEVHALIGPNGAGKTTFIHHLSGALLPDAGQIRFSGRDITRLSMHERVQAGMARSYQITNVFAGLSALDNVALAVQGRLDAGSSFRFWRPVTSETTLFAEADAWLAQVGLADKADAVGGSLSHGEQRALELAMALATKPQLLLLDEPTASLDAANREVVLELIEEAKARGAAILGIFHDEGARTRVCDRLVDVTCFTPGLA